MKEITENMVKEAIEAGWDETDARRGYAIFISEFGNGAEHIERIDEMGVFDSDEEAAMQAEKDGIALIHDMKFEGCDFQYYIDTPENRELLKDLVISEVN